MVSETKVYKQGVVRTRLPPKASGKNPSLPLPSFRWFPAILERADSFEKTWCWERLKAGGQGDDRGWDGWMASPTQWTWVWVNSGSWWWTGRPGVLQSMGLQRVGHDWGTELNWPVHISDVSKFCPFMYTKHNQSLPLISQGVLFLFFQVILFLKYWKMQSNFSRRKGIPLVLSLKTYVL